uniref:NADH-ubiquinone oxidoreductase chain 6 n=1 Tax=Brachytemnus porcatus TaxID=1069889 RepID=J9PH75_9CUCU|nr:NADH dehydrogenase subunit 6 [Brachytemnus porcatus]
MLAYLFTLSWIFAMIFIFLNHPLSLGSILLIQTILVTLTTSSFYMNSWFGYILFLVMIGGMLVMFLYMTSIASNEKFKLPKKMMISAIFIITILFLLFIIINDDFFSFLINYMKVNFTQSNLPSKTALKKFFSFPDMQMMIVLMIYLFITLIASVKIVGKSKNTLRQR